jgi:hypothetical protein
MRKDIFTLFLILFLSFIVEIGFHLYRLKKSKTEFTEMKSFHSFKVDDQVYKLEWFNHDTDQKIQLTSDSTKNPVTFYLNQFNYNIHNFNDLPIQADSYMKQTIISILQLSHPYQKQIKKSKTKTIFFDDYLPTFKAINALTPEHNTTSPSLHFRLNAFQTIQNKRIVNVKSDQYIKRINRNIENISDFKHLSPVLALHIHTFDETLPLSSNLINIIPVTNFPPEWKELFFVSRIEAVFYLRFSYFSGCNHKTTEATFLDIKKSQTRKLFKFSKNKILKLSRAGCNIDKILFYVDKKGPIYPSEFNLGLIYYSM